MPQEQWIVVGQAVRLNTVTQKSVLLSKDSQPFTPIKDRLFQGALQEGKITPLRVKRVPAFTREQAESFAKDHAKEAKKIIEAKEEAKELSPEELADQHVQVFVDFGLSDRIAESLVEYGYVTIESLATASDDDLLEINGIGASTLQFIREANQG